jgi:hypothetical protein
MSTVFDILEKGHDHAVKRVPLFPEIHDAVARLELGKEKR